MIGFLFSSWSKYIAIGLVFALLLGGVFIYVKTTQEQIKRLSKELSETKIALDASNKIVEEQKANAERQARLMQAARAQFLRAEAARAELERMVRQSNIQKEAASNPSEIEKKINESQEAMRRALEALSRSITQSNLPSAPTQTTSGSRR